MRLMVGCPVAHRVWILPRWFEHVRKACGRAGVEPDFVFVCDPGDPSWRCISQAEPTATFVSCTTTQGADVRRWNQRRYAEMVLLRNALLGAVRRSDPDVFLSLDSDILVHPDQVTVLLEDLDRFDAVGGRCFMTASGIRFPSYAQLNRDGGLRRIDAAGVFPVDVIMAIKMMSRAAYDVDYVIDVQGEDIGWSKAARAQGLKLGWDGRVISKHVLGPHLLGRRDDRVGF